MNPMDTLEVAVEQRLVGLLSATKTLKDFMKRDDGRRVMVRSRCKEELVLVRDELTNLIKQVERGGTRR